MVSGTTGAWCQTGAHMITQVTHSLVITAAPEKIHVNTTGFGLKVVNILGYKYVCIENRNSMTSEF